MPYDNWETKLVSISSLIAPLAILQFVVAFFYGVYEFTPLNQHNAMDPVVPIWFKALKDVFFALIVILFLILLTNRSFPIPYEIAVFMAIPIVLMVITITFSVSKFSPDADHIGVLKNYGLYYFGAGVMMAALRMVQWHVRALTVLRACMCASILFGLAVYLLPDEDGWRWSHQGRMIATIGNPNTFAYLCVLNLAILHGALCWKGRLTQGQAVEFVLSYLGLVFSRSVAGLGVTVLFITFLYVLVMYQGTQSEEGRTARLFIKREIIAAVTIACALGAIVMSPISSIVPYDIRDKYLALVLPEQSTSTSVIGRLSPMRELADQISAIPIAAVIGNPKSGEYVKYDSSLFSLAHNYGVPILVAWVLYFLAPVMRFCLGRWRGLARGDEAGSMCMALSAFVLSTVLFHGWVHYATETFPSCFAFGYILAFILWEARVGPPVIDNRATV